MIDNTVFKIYVLIFNLPVVCYSVICLCDNKYGTA